jgi:hypothetical protein
MKNASSHENKSLVNFLFFLSLILSIVTLVFRSPETFTKPQFWAEDGAIFFREYFLNGRKSFFAPYAGYLHLIPRLCAGLLFHISSFKNMPLAFNLVSLLSVLSIIVFIWVRTSFDPYIKFFMSLALGLAPIGSEIVLNLTNMQWYLCFFIPLIFLAGFNKKYAYLDLTAIFLVSLTGPFSIIFIPLISVIVWYRAKRFGQWGKERVYFFVYLLGAIIQLVVFVSSAPREAQHYSIKEKIVRSPLLIYKHVTSPLGRTKLYVDGAEKNNFLFVICLLGFAGWLYLCWRKFNKEKNPMPMFFMIGGLLLAASSVYGIAPPAVPSLNPITGGCRYFFGPCVLFLWSVLAYSFKLHEDTESVGANRRNIAFLLLFAYYAAVLAYYIPQTHLTDLNWPEQAEKLKNYKGGHLSLPINPEPWSIPLDQ